MCMAVTCFAVISIHSLPKEGDEYSGDTSEGLLIFQSTPSPRRETIFHSDRVLAFFHFNPLPPQGGRRNCCKR